MAAPGVDELSPPILGTTEESEDVAIVCLTLCMKRCLLLHCIQYPIMGVDYYQVVSMMPTERKFHSVNRWALDRGMLTPGRL